MPNTQQDCRRRARRINATLQVKFSINNGPEEVSDTLNFTYRSLAIRSCCAVEKGDKVVAKIGNLPALKGNVVRVFDEGFAMQLTEMSLALTAYAETELPREDQDEHASDKEHTRMIGPMFKADAPFPSWARIATSRPGATGADRHYLSIITTDSIDLDAIKSVWISIDETRWVARLLQASKRGKQSVIVIMMNAWQLHMAATFGASVSIICDQLYEWTADMDAPPFADHVQLIDPQEKALSA